MKRFLTILLCIVYTTISFGGSVYMHNCCGGTSISIYEKDGGHDKCPNCTKKQSPNSKKPQHKTCAEGKCSDIEIKIDQLEDKLFAGQSNLPILFTPAILERFWVNLKPASQERFKAKQPLKDGLVCRDSSPPTFLMNCIFRI